MKRSKKKRMRKNWCFVLTGAMMFSGVMGLQVSAAQPEGSEKYTVEYMEEDGFYRVTNPNGGARLSYTTLELLEVEEDGVTYAFKDLDKDGELDLYEDWREDAQTRAEDLVSKLSVERMAGLMLHPNDETTTDGTLTEKNLVLTDEQGVRFILDNNLSVDGVPLWNNAMQAHLEETDEFSIPINVSSDPKNTVNGGRETVFTEAGYSAWPGNLGVAATFDPQWALTYGQIASQEYRAMGITTALSPQVDLATEPRWTRFSGTFGEGSKLAGEMAAGYVWGFQSTWDGVGADAEDLGWGEDSVVTMIKHFPGDGAAEAGREAHNNYGKYNVYPGDNMAEHYSVFEAAFNIEESLTGGAKAVMPSYSIAIDQYGNSIGAGVASGYSSYKLTDILRGELGYDGLICSDWNITANIGTCWGVENLTMIQRHLLAIEAGLNQFGGSNTAIANIKAYEMGILKEEETGVYLSTGNALWCTEDGLGDGEETMYQKFFDSAVECVKLSFYTGLFDDPYICKAEGTEALNNAEYKETAYQCQLASVVMLKNKGNVISETAQGEKKTVYVPMTYTPEREQRSFGPGGSGEATIIPASIDVAFSNMETLSQFFEVVTDEINPDADMDHLTEEDLIRRTDFTGVDFALTAISGPVTGGYNQNLVDLDGSDGSIDNGYYPISLQYGEYYADPDVVRDHPLGLDADEELEWIEAGGEEGTSRYYGGKFAQNNDQSTLEGITQLRQNVGDLPIVVYAKLSNPACFYEFEPMVDGIIVGFAISDKAAIEVISGNYEPSGLLPCQMPANMEMVETQYEDVPFDMECHVDTEGNVYDYAFGLNWSGVIDDWRVEEYGR
ncbi:MAG: glycoside hydrolase family 3 N-terminal domain-containing protein [Lachnospiraceae bacterium]|nr:beta-glucosidase [Robinsoniella sp.]MDY3766952.1 glycoside hydrolase family 3 N-terminal domain-containing protein [Lachnospiraceae bacterium]